MALSRNSSLRSAKAMKPSVAAIVQTAVDQLTDPGARPTAWAMVQVESPPTSRLAVRAAQSGGEQHGHRRRRPPRRW